MSSQEGGYVSFAFEVHVNPENDPPSIQGPSGETWVGKEDSKVLLGNSGGIVLSDPDWADYDGDLMEVKVVVGLGALSLSLIHAGGLHLLSGDGPEGSSEFWARGGLVELNRALQGLTYHPPEQWSGVVEMDVWVSDLGGYQDDSTLEASAIFSVTVEAVADPPQMRFPLTVHYLDEDTSIAIGFVNVSDADPGSVLVLQAQPDDGVIEIQPDYSEEDVWSRIEISRNASDEEQAEEGQQGGLVLRGAAADVDAAVRLLMYTPTANFAGQVVVSLRVTDESGLFVDDETYLYVRAVNDPPVIELQAGEDMATSALEMTAGGAGDAIVGVAITDVDAADSFDLCDNFQGVEARNALSLNLSAEYGSVSIVAESAIGVRVVDDAAAGPGETLLLQGSVRSLQSAFDQSLVLYSAPSNFSGRDTIEVAVDDGGNCGAGGAKSTSLSLEVDVGPYEPPLVVSFDASAVDVDSPLFTTEGESLVLPDIVVTGGSVGEGSPVEVVVLAKSGKVSLQVTDLDNVEVFDSGDEPTERLRVRGSPGVLTTVLTGLSFEPRPHFFGCWDRNMSCADDTPVRFSRLQGTAALARVYVVATSDGGGKDVDWDGVSVKPDASRSIAYLKVSVGWVNDPPTVEAPDTVVVSGDLLEPSPLPGILVSDVDVLDAREGLGRLDVNVSASMGSKLSVDARIALKNGLSNIGSDEQQVRLRGRPEYVNNVLATLTISGSNDTAISSALTPGERIEEIEVVVSDMGFSGEGGEQSATASIIVEAGVSTLDGKLEYNDFTLEKMLPLVSTTEGTAVALPGLEAAFSGSGDVDNLSVVVSAKEGYLSLGPSSAGVAEAAAKEDWGSAVTIIHIGGGAEQTLPEVQVRKHSKSLWWNTVGTHCVGRGNPPIPNVTVKSPPRAKYRQLLTKLHLKYLAANTPPERSTSSGRSQVPPALCS